METVAGSAALTTAVVAALRGEHDRVVPLLARVRTAVIGRARPWPPWQHRWAPS